MKDSLVQQCLDILKKEDIKKEIKLLLNPIKEFIMYEMYPYIYIIFFLILFLFIMVLAILVILLRNNYKV